VETSGHLGCVPSKRSKFIKAGGGVEPKQGGGEKEPWITSTMDYAWSPKLGGEEKNLGVSPLSRAQTQKDYWSMKRGERYMGGEEDPRNRSHMTRIISLTVRQGKAPKASPDSIHGETTGKNLVMPNVKRVKGHEHRWGVRRGSPGSGVAVPSGTAREEKIGRSVNGREIEC